MARRHPFKQGPGHGLERLERLEMAGPTTLRGGPDRLDSWAMKAGVLAALIGWVVPAAAVPLPEVKAPGMELRLMASEPEIVTPIGLAVGPNGDLYVVESHTHQRPDDYDGPETDRIQRFRPSGDGESLELAGTYAAGFHHAMHLEHSPGGELYLTHRNGVVKLGDSNEDGESDRKETILQLETPGSYPHNGIGGMAFSPDGWLYVGMGENLGEPYTLHGSDGSSHSGGGEGGNIFRCRPDGSRLEHVATGFWNPFGLGFFGRDYLLCVDNDPDGRPPCRLLDVIRFGDYGYEYRYGRSGLHPYSAWDGELPGTLPMIAGTGEAPSDLIAGAATQLPKTYRDVVLVTSWGDHRIEVFRPIPHGASLKAERSTLIQGDTSFRPVAFGIGPQGEVYFSDWVNRDYAVHQKGRIWQLRATEPSRPYPEARPVDPGPDRKRLETLLGSGGTESDRLDALEGGDPFLQTAAIGALAAHASDADLLSLLQAPNERVRLGALLALKRRGYEAPGSILYRALGDPAESVRAAALLWVGESGLTALAPDLNRAMTSGPTSERLVRLYSETSDRLQSSDESQGAQEEAERDPASEGPDSQSLRITRRAPDVAVDEAVATLASPDLQPDGGLRLNAVRRLYWAQGDEATRILKEVATDPKEPAIVRAEALTALANAAPVALVELKGLLSDDSPLVRLTMARLARVVADDESMAEALADVLGRSRGEDDDAAFKDALKFALEWAGVEDLGDRGLSDRPDHVDGWIQRLETMGRSGDVEAGRRVFFNPTVQCAQCHRVGGHGADVGPDLSVIGRGMDRRKLLESIIDPSAEVGPEFVTHTIETPQGRFAGVSPGVGPDGAIPLLSAGGTTVWIPGARIQEHQTDSVSLMPKGLDRVMTEAELQDLLAFLESRR